MCVLSVCGVSGVIPGLSCLYQQLWSRGAAVTVEAVSTFSTWRDRQTEDGGEVNVDRDGSKERQVDC